jgi:hypothetical protein
MHCFTASGLSNYSAMRRRHHHRARGWLACVENADLVPLPDKPSWLRGTALKQGFRIRVWFDKMMINFQQMFNKSSPCAMKSQRVA